MFETLGYTVTALKRISIGEVKLGNLPLGRWRHLTSHEINWPSGVNFKELLQIYGSSFYLDPFSITSHILSYTSFKKQNSSKKTLSI